MPPLIEFIVCLCFMCDRGGGKWILIIHNLNVCMSVHISRFPYVNSSNPMSSFVFFFC
jgi:hypothetical protein